MFRKIKIPAEVMCAEYGFINNLWTIPAGSPDWQSHTGPGKKICPVLPLHPHDRKNLSFLKNILNFFKKVPISV
jgi:hypothetical protein